MNKVNDAHSLSNDTYLTVKEVAKRLKLGRESTYKLVRLKGFPKIIIGKQIRVPKYDFEKWLFENQNTRIAI